MDEKKKSDILQEPNDFQAPDETKDENEFVFGEEEKILNKTYLRNHTKTMIQNTRNKYR